jgi:hypothetical protein
LSYSVFIIGNLICIKIKTPKLLSLPLRHLGVIVIFLSFFVEQYNTANQEKANQVTQFKSQDRSIGIYDIERIFIENPNELFPLYLEMNQQNPLIAQLPNARYIDVSKKILLESIVADLHFRRMNSILIEMTPIDNYQALPEYTEYVRTWKEWFKSPTLLYLWDTNKYTTASDLTINFIDHVILNR